MILSSTSANEAMPDLMAALDAGVNGMKIGVPSEYVMMDDEVVALWRQGQAWLRDAGAELVEISLPHTKYALPAYYIIAPAEASSISHDGVRPRVEADCSMKCTARPVRLGLAMKCSAGS